MPPSIIPTMLVRDIGEFELIDALAEIVGASGASTDTPARGSGFRLRHAIGDDAAAWDAPAGTTVMTTDALVEGVHFDLAHTGWRDLGWKALAASLSDVAAMGCMPLYSVVSLGLRGDLPMDGILDLYRGIADAAVQHGGRVVGGDVARSATFFLAVSMVGTVPTFRGDRSSGLRPLTRSGARPKEQIAVTGSLGCSAGGLGALQGAANAEGNIKVHLIEAHNRPALRVTEGMLLLERGVRAAMDVSDGLMQDVGKLCKASGVGARLYSNQVPADDYLKAGYPDGWMKLALTGGEDYELLFTAPQKRVEEIALVSKVPVTVVGEIVPGTEGVTVFGEDGLPVEIEHGGWDHFRSG